MRPTNLSTRIFLDGGDPAEARDIIALLGFLDGQTTNPTLIAKNPEVQAQLARGDKFTTVELLKLYQKVVRDISALIPQGSVSVEVYADHSTTAQQMLEQGREMYAWIPNAHIKLPITTQGLLAAEQAVKEGMRVNMTLCFSQEQAAAVYAATQGAQKGQVFVSPFVGRLDDKGENGMELIANIIRMHNAGDPSTKAELGTGRSGHVEVLTASVRHLSHLMQAFALRSDIVTAPFKVLKEWGELGMPMMASKGTSQDALSPMPYQEIDLSMPWETLDITHELTEKGMAQFSQDWNALISGCALKQNRIRLGFMR